MREECIQLAEAIARSIRNGCYLQAEGLTAQLQEKLQKLRAEMWRESLHHETHCVHGSPRCPMCD